MNKILALKVPLKNILRWLSSLNASMSEPETWNTAYLEFWVTEPAEVKVYLHPRSCFSFLIWGAVKHCIFSKPITMQNDREIPASIISFLLDQVLQCASRRCHERTTGVSLFTWLPLWRASVLFPLFQPSKISAVFWTAKEF